MEPLKSQLSLRSLDAVGRPSGTGRSSRVSSRHATFSASSVERSEAIERREAERSRAQTGHEARRAEARREERDGPETRPEDRTGPRADEIERPPRDEASSESTSRKSPARPENAPASESAAATEAPVQESPADPQPSAKTARAVAPANLLRLALASNDPSASSPMMLEALALAVDSGPTLAPANAAAYDFGSLDEGAYETAGGKSTAPLAASGAAANPAQRAGLAAAAHDSTQPATRTEESASTGTRPEVADTRARTERAERILDQVRLRIRPELSEATVELRPRELGRIAIQLSVREGRVRASVRAERAEALAVLEAHVPELRAMFEAVGLEPHALEVGMGFAHEGSRHSGLARESGDEHDARRASPAVESAGAAPAYEPLALALADHMGIDTYA